MTARIATLCAALLFLGGCYLPLNFEADINIDEKGGYAGAL